MISQATDLSGDFLSAFDVVVMVNQPLDTLLRVNDITRANGRKLVAANAHGLFAVAFNDFGDDFEVTDTDGEQPISAMISAVAADGTVTCQDETRHGFEEGDHVTFREVKGLEALNGCEPLPIKVLGPYTFTIGEEAVSKAGGKYVEGGFATQVKMPKKIQFKPLKDVVKAGGEDCLITDFCKFDRPQQIQVRPLIILITDHGLY